METAAGSSTAGGYRFQQSGDMGEAKHQASTGSGATGGTGAEVGATGVSSSSESPSTTYNASGAKEVATLCLQAPN